MKRSKTEVLGAVLFWLGFAACIGVTARPALPPPTSEAERWGRIVGSLLNLFLVVIGAILWLRARRATKKER